MLETPLFAIDRPDDPLSQLIRLLQPGRFTWKVGEQAGCWRTAFPATSGVAFALVIAGDALARTGAGDAYALGVDDFLLLVQPRDWTLRSGPTGVATRIIGGHFHLDPANAGFLIGILPGSVHARAGDPGTDCLRTLVGLIGDEADTARPGQSLVVERLVELLVLQAIRLASERSEDARPGLLAGLHDRRVGAALRALHRDPTRGWTVSQLAASAGMSRSAFADRFQRITGVPPLTYVLRWRIALARHALRSTTASLAEIAAACGYASTGAFSNAFGKVVGTSPAAFARSADAPVRLAGRKRF